MKAKEQEIAKLGQRYNILQGDNNSQGDGYSKKIIKESKQVFEYEQPC